MIVFDFSNIEILGTCYFVVVEKPMEHKDTFPKII